MRTLNPATITHQQLALLHNALTVAWLALPAAILVLASVGRWPWAGVCLLLDISVAWARSWTFQQARQHHRTQLQARSWRKKSRQKQR